MRGKLSPLRRSAGRLIGFLLLVLVVGCGGGGDDSSEPNGPGNGGSTFPNREGTPSVEPPPSVQTARVAFASDDGEQCCVALPAEAIPAGALLVLDDLPAGPATVFVSFFAEDFAPSLDGFEATCATLPADIGEPCDMTQVASPTYESEAQRVDIVPGGQTNVADLMIHALPFVFDFTPESGDTVSHFEDLIGFAFTIGDPVTGVEEESVVLEVTLQEPQGSSFRPLTKRVELQLSACSDGTAEPCSSEGDRDVVGFFAAGATRLLPGPVDVQITGVNQDDPVRGVDFRYSFEVAE